MKFLCKLILLVSFIVVFSHAINAMEKPSSVKSPASQMNYRNVILGMLTNLINGSPLAVSAYSAAELGELLKAIDAAERNPAEIQSMSKQMMIEQDVLPVYLNDIKQRVLEAIKQGRVQGGPLVPTTIPVPQVARMFWGDSASRAQADLLPLAERKKLFAAAGAKPAEASPISRSLSPVTVPVAQPAIARSFGLAPVAVPIAQAVTARKFEFSNQSNQMAAAWIPKYQNGWLPITLTPERDSGPVIPLEGQTIYIYTSGGFYIMRVQDGLLSLNKENPDGAGNARLEVIKTMPYRETTDILVIINPDGSVNFAKRRP